MIGGQSAPGRAHFTAENFGATATTDAGLVNVTSGSAFVPLSGTPTYCASKAALHSYTLSLREQLKGKVEVIELAPPGIRTELEPGQSSRGGLWLGYPAGKPRPAYAGGRHHRLRRARGRLPACGRELQGRRRLQLRPLLRRSQGPDPQ
ncbi:hypothetical protein CDO28_23555 (plasmid) [Sinorhizobium meliloti]|nr:hypothetical protein CDO28_23555 [Sinorhizobium meliloti]MDE3857466.1 SDR family NAD(P)-dependent oxidoreductase [Sinorhizobium meliloti]